ncbi:MAG TPA: hypothetical protein VGX28_15440 [Frankiaceae bacterium]|nr:hypothetical protein [Frankiaceae bacterium]
MVDLFMGTSRVARIDMAGTLLNKAQWVIPAFASVRSGSVSLRVVSTGKTVQIDGIGVSRVAYVRLPF